MGFFKEKLCAHCGYKAGMLKSTLGDGRYICSKCSKPVPYELSKFWDEYDYQGFQNLLDYLESSNKEFGKKFRETHRFQSLHLDTEHGLFYIDNMYPTVYFLLQEVEEFKLEYRPETIKEGFFGDKVNGNVYIRMRMNFPYMFKDDVLAKDLKASATTKGLFDKKVVYDNPKGMDEFYIAFLDGWECALKAQTRELERLTAELRELNASVDNAE